METIKKVPEEVVKVFTTREPTRILDPKAKAAAENIAAWPSHIPKAPIYRLAQALLQVKIPAMVKGFIPFTVRAVTGGTNVERFGAGTLVMVLPKYGDSVQAAVTAAQVRNNTIGKTSIIWDEAQSRPATPEEVEQFLSEAFYRD